MKKINRLLAFLLAFTVVITTFSSDITAAHVYATEEEAVIDSENEIKTVEKEEIPVVSEASTEESTEASTEGSTEEAATAADTEENAGEGDKNNDAATAGIDGEVVNPEAVGEEETKETEERVKEFKESKTIDGIEISLYAEPEVLPDDAILDITKVEDEEEDQIKELIDNELGEEVKVKKTFSYDINIVSSETGEKYKPEDGTVEVKFAKIKEAASDAVALEVYHVKDDLSSAESVSDVVEKGTEISFDAEHFSIYAVTLTVYGRNTSYTDSFDLQQVDVDLNRINGNSSIPITFNKGTITVDELKNRISSYTPNGYSLLGIYAKGGLGTKYVVSSFTYDGYLIKYTAQDGQTHYADLAQGIYAIYRKNDQTTTSHHIDLGFTESDFNKYLNKASVSVKIGNDGQFQSMDVDTSVYHDNYDGGDYYEYRINTEPISVNTPITFKVVYNGDSYTMRCDSAKNIAAFERCFKAHWATQDEFGFDFVSDFTQDFLNNATVYYHSNFGSDPEKIVDTVNVPWTAHSETETTTTYSYKTSYPAGQTSKPDAEFKGWGMKNAQGEVVKIVGPTITVSKTTPTNLYAIWEDTLVPVAVYATDGTSHPNTKGALATTLRLNYVQGDHYYPIGVVYLPTSIFAGKDNNFIQSKSDWEAVEAALSGATKEYNYNGRNADNIVFDSLQYVQADTNYGEGSLHTALFKWNRKEEEGSITNPETGFFKYHLDLRFATNVVEYEARYFENAEYKGATTLSSLETAYLKDPSNGNKSNATLPTSSQMQAYKTYEGVDYTFDGFYKVVNGQLAKIDSTTVEIPDSEGKYKVVAKYSKVVKFTVTYTDGVADEVVFADQGPTEVLKGAATPAFVTTNQDGKPSRVGYKFKGWYSSETQTTTMTVPAKVTATVTYTAQWEADFAQYVVEYYKQNVDDAEYSLVTSATKTFNNKKTGEKAYYDKSRDNILAEDEVKDGFAYVKTEANLTGDNFAVVTNDNDIKVRADGALVIRVYFKRNTYKVTYKYDDQKGKVKNINPAKAPEDKTEYRYGQTVTVDTTKPTATGYTFDGWYFADDTKKETFIIKGNTELTGKFLPKEKINYTIKYYQQNTDDDEYTLVGEPLNRPGKYTDNVIYTASDRDDNRYVGFHYAKTKVLLTGEEPVEYGKDAVIPDIPVPAETNTLVIEVYYDREVYEVTYSYVGTVPKIVDPTEAELVGYKKSYRFGQLVTVAADAKAPGYTFDGWKAYTDNSGSQLEQQVVSADEVETNEEGVAAAIKKFFKFVAKTITGEDGSETEVSTFEMPPSNVSIEGSFTKSPYNIVIELKGNAEGGSFDYELPYIADKQTAPVEFELDVYLNDDLISASAATSENLDVLMASLDKAMSLGALTVYAAEGEELPIAEPIAVNEVKTYKGEAQEVVKTVEKKVTVDGREYTVTVNLAGGYGTDARDYDIYIDSLTFKLGDKDVSDLFTTNMVEKQVVGKLTITPAMITIKADDKSKTEGQADPTFTSKLSGLVGKDAEHQEEVDNFILPQVKYDREKGEAPRRYKITPRAPREDEYEQVIVVHPGDENNLRSLEEASQQLEELSREDAIQAGVEEYLEQGVVKELQDREEYQLPPVIRILRNYDYQFVDGYLTINGRGGGDDEEYVPRDPDADSPVAAAPAPAVLGAQRELPGEAPAVLGARRAGTSDTNILGSIITIIVAAAIAFSMVFIKRKKKEEN